MKRITLFLLFFFVFKASFSQTTFGPRHDISENIIMIRSLTYGDFNVDGYKDILALYYDKISWFENDGEGNLITQRFIEQEDYSTSIFVIDIDDDWDDDILAIFYDQIVLFKNDGIGNFEKTVVTPNDCGAYRVSAADLDTDGDNDIIFAPRYGDEIYWLENDGNNHFGNRRTITTRNYNNLNSIISVDFNNDGFIDIIPNSEYSYSLYWYKNDRYGNFQTMDLIKDSDEIKTFVIADLDKDGDNDIIAAMWNAIVWYENDGSEEFLYLKCIAFNVESNYAVYVSDLDNDGDNDVIFSSYNSRIFGWCRNDGNENFSEPQILSSTYPIDITSVFATDIDEDGDNDIISANRDLICKIDLFKNDGNGNFNLEQTISGYKYINNFFPVDIDGDGDNDVLMASSYWENEGGVIYFENRGNNSFGIQKYITTNKSTSVYSADIDGDEDNDVLSCSKDNNSLIWFQNDGTGNFSNQQVVDSNINSPISIYITDLDKDGDNDILSNSFIYPKTYKLFWFENNGTGDFGEKVMIDPGKCKTYLPADLDMDGDIDILNATYDSLYWFKNDGNGNFNIQYIATNGNFKFIYVTDLDNDNDNDIISFFYNKVTSKYTIGWYKNDGVGNYGPVNIIEDQGFSSISWENNGLISTDFDNDGDDDVLFADDDRMILYENLGSANFNSEHNVIYCTNIRINFSDIDGDNDQDILFISDYSGWQLRWFENQYNYVSNKYKLICEGDSVPFANSWISDQGTYYDTAKTAYGGDSIVVFNLEVSYDFPPAFDITGLSNVNETQTETYMIHEDWNVRFIWDIENGDILNILPDTIAVIYWHSPCIGKINVTSIYPPTGCSSLSTLNVLINKIDKKNIFFYPNPAREEIYITPTSQIITVIIYDSYGRLLLKSNNKTINVSQLSKGMYYVLLKDDKGNLFSTKKLAIQ